MLPWRSDLCNELTSGGTESRLILSGVTGPLNRVGVVEVGVVKGIRGTKWDFQREVANELN